MSKLDSLSEEEKRILKTFLEIEDDEQDEKLERYLSTVSTSCFNERLTKRLTKKPLSESKVINCEPEDMFSPSLFHENIKLFRNYLIQLKKFEPVTKPTPLTRGTSHNTGFSSSGFIEEYKPTRRNSFDGVKGTSKKETRKRSLSIGGSIHRRKRKTTRRSTRRRR